jgi:phage gp46-like protein
MMALQPVYELAGEQDDPFTEEVLAVLFSDQPERVEVRPEDNQRHWQWWARSPSGQTSRGWIGFAEPLTDEVPALLEQRYESALTTAFVPAYAVSVTVTVRQVRINTLAISWVITREFNQVITGGVILSQGG